MPADVRDAYIKENGQLIDEGIDDLKKALELRPDYDDAMAYLNLLLRRKADEAATPDERAVPVEAGRRSRRKGQGNQAEENGNPGQALADAGQKNLSLVNEAARKRAAFYFASPAELEMKIQLR